MCSLRMCFNATRIPRKYPMSEKICCWVVPKLVRDLNWLEPPPLLLGRLETALMPSSLDPELIVPLFRLSLPPCAQHSFTHFEYLHSALSRKILRDSPNYNKEVGAWWLSGLASGRSQVQIPL